MGIICFLQIPTRPCFPLVRLHPNPPFKTSYCTRRPAAPAAAAAAAAARAGARRRGALGGNVFVCVREHFGSASFLY